MRAATIFTAAFAAAVMASPVDRRDEVIVTATDVDYVTDIVTVTAGQEPASTQAPVAPAAVTTSSAAPAQGQHYGHKHHKKPKPSSSAAPAPAPIPTTSVSVAPAPPASSSAAPAPAPAPSSYSPPPPASSSAAAPPPASSSAAPAPSGQAGVSYKQDVVTHHNLHRSNYSSPALTWDDALAAAAKVTADSCNWGHQGGVNGLQYGQNIAAGTPAGDIANIISQQFFNGEVNAYVASLGSNGQPDMSTFENWGHFSQVVWAASTTVGCYTTDCGATMGLTTLNNIPADQHIPPFFTVCNYGPAGNVDGEYAQNIGTCKDQPTVQKVQDAEYATTS